MAKVKQIKWEKEQPPNNVCGYDHVIGKTPLGKFRITWKGWKESPSYDLEFEFDKSCFHYDDSLDGLKEITERLFKDMINSCLEKEG